MTVFKISTEPLDLPLKRRFVISRGGRNEVNNVLIRLVADGVTGIGEAAPNHRYNESQESVVANIKKMDNCCLDNPYDIDAFVAYMSGKISGEFAARAGLEMALYDWIGKKLDLPLYKLLQAPGRVGPRTTFTIGIDSLDVLRDKIDEAGSYPLLKIKLGTDHDREIINEIRSLTNKPLLVDANEGWQTLEHALKMVRFLEKKGVYIIEQPMPVDCINEMRELKRKSHIPLFADESITGSGLDPELSGLFHGINIKLMKTGAISTSLKIIHQARKSGLQIMVGCMVESAIADTASALVALWADFADLDGHLLLKENPYSGMQVLPEGNIQLNNRPGLGLEKK